MNMFRTVFGIYSQVQRRIGSLTDSALTGALQGNELGVLAQAVRYDEVRMIGYREHCTSLWKSSLFSVFLWRSVHVIIFQGGHGVKI